MHTLIVNCGSTSTKASIVNTENGVTVTSFKAERLGSPNAILKLGDKLISQGELSHAQSLQSGIPALLAEMPENAKVMCVGHRVVHGGSEFTQPTVVDDSTLAALTEIESLAPLHNPINVEGIRIVRQMLPDITHVAVFDTAFHRTLPTRAREYALPKAIREKHSIQRYGFHGTSHQFVAQRAADYLGEDLRDLRIISCHLGGGCSVCAIENGRSVETSMGMTPLEGLVMATRSGDIDPGVLSMLVGTGEFDWQQVDELLNRSSGLLGLSGTSGDMRDIEQRAEEGDANCQLAIQVFCHRVRKYIGAYAATMGGVNAIIFTGGIGQNSAVVRHRCSQRFEFLGARVDEDLNRGGVVAADRPVVDFSLSHSRVRLLAVQTDEALAIALQAAELVKAAPAQVPVRKIPVAISARHLHLRQETVEALFGAGHELTEFKPLSQPGQFAANEQVTLVGPKRSIERVRVLGPARPVDQVEISRTDEFYLGIDAPVRASGDVENSPGITLVGTEGRQVTLEKGVICAWRHIHMTPEDAESFGVEDREIVDVEVGVSGVRSLTFGDVLVRVKPTYKLEMHIDTDEGNAAELDRHDVGQVESVLHRRSQKS